MSPGSTYKILIAGIGGVGGYFGGRLAQHFQKVSGVEILFLCRGEQLTAIRNKGLRIIHNKEEFLAYPHGISDDASKFGLVDAVLICSKNYSLIPLLGQLKNCIHQNTVIVPLMNGIEAYETIQNYFPQSNVTRACVYVVARKQEAGIINSSGSLQKIYFGPGNDDRKFSLALENKLQLAGIDVSYREDIISLTWEKFLFISPLATATSYFDCSIGLLLEDNLKKNILMTMIDELYKISQALKIELPDDVIQKITDRIHSLPYQNTSSMHIDFSQKRGNTELESLTGHAIRLGRDTGIATPAFETCYQALRLRI